jgi:SAM-dependent methyltransferase
MRPPPVQPNLPKVLDLLPDGGNVLEMGCGSGSQSLELARSGRFQVTLLDFSEKALDHARNLFERESLTASFVLADAFQPGEGQYDLVFNAGVIEHYSEEQQVALLRSMAMRSRKYVMAVAPNRLCEWYWLWRIQASSQANWPFGKEVPLIDLSQVMQEAGMNFIGQAFMGENWTESFINGIYGIDDELRQLALDIHRSPLLSPPQKSYLVAGLGSVAPATHPAGWGPPSCR